MNVNSEAVLKWYSGKALAKATAAMTLLLESIQAGQWIPKASRSVRAALGKHNIANKFAKGHRGWLEQGFIDPSKAMSEWEDAAPQMGRQIYRAMHYGILSGVSILSTAPLRVKLGVGGLELPQSIHFALDRIDQYIQDFGPVGDAMDKLDATRPKPVFTSIGVSPTVTKTLEDAGLDLDLSTIRICPIRWEKVEYLDKDGHTCYKWVGGLEFPEGTRHHRSRFAGPNAIFDHCEACGHTIRNPFNWVPFVINGKNGTPYSLWTGRDCAETLFGVKMVGELELSRPMGS